MTTDLIPKNITPIKLFSENGLDPVLDKIKAEIDKFEPNIETAKGRKEIAEAKAANKRHQASVNNKIKGFLLRQGVDEDKVKPLIIAIAKCECPFLVIKY